VAGGGVSYVVYLYLVRGAPVLKDVPYDSVVAEPREEVEDGVLRRQLAALREAADGEDVAVGRSVDKAFDRAPCNTSEACSHPHRRR
jgi:hypothetical protein